MNLEPAGGKDHTGYAVREENLLQNPQGEGREITEAASERGEISHIISIMSACLYMPVSSRGCIRGVKQYRNVNVKIFFSLTKVFIVFKLGI